MPTLSSNMKAETAPATPFVDDGGDLAAQFDITLSPIASTDVCVIHLGSDGILYFQYRPNAREGVEEFAHYRAQLDKQMEARGFRAPMVVDMTNLGAITKESRQEHAKEESLRHFTALALVVKSPLARAMGGFFIVLDRPLVPTRLFATVAQAREWALQRRQNRPQD
jgi:hypothetical protein